MTTTLDAPAPPPSSPEQESTTRRIPFWMRILGALVALFALLGIMAGIGLVILATQSHKHCTAGAISSCQYAGASSASTQQAWTNSLNGQIDAQIIQEAGQQGLNIIPSCPDAPAKTNYQFVCNATVNGQSGHILVTILNTHGDATWKLIDGYPQQQPQTHGCVRNADGYLDCTPVFSG
jgi:hypothetical protein